MRTGRGPGQIAAGVYLVLLIAFLFSPLVVMTLFSFHDSPRLSFPIEGVSFRWYEDIFGDQEFRDGFRRTALLAVGTALISGTMGMLAALGLVRLGTRVRLIVLTCAAIPLAFPALLYAIGLAFFYHELGVGFSLWATLFGHVVITLPFVFLVVGASLERFRFSMLEAAQDLGASPLHAFRTITLPHILPAVLGAMLLAMAISVDEFVIAFFTAGQEKTLPMLLYGRLNLGVTPALNVIGVVLLVLTTALAVIAARRTTRELGR
jgi:spermidine/putrescine transport system permease protein